MSAGGSHFEPRFNISLFFRYADQLRRLFNAGKMSFTTLRPRPAQGRECCDKVFKPFNYVGRAVSVDFLTPRSDIDILPRHKAPGYEMVSGGQNAVEGDISVHRAAPQSTRSRL